MHTSILDPWQLVAGTCLSQEQTEGQLSEDWGELWLSLFGTKRLSSLVPRGNDGSVAGRVQEAGGLEISVGLGHQYEQGNPADLGEGPLQASEV